LIGKEKHPVNPHTHTHIPPIQTKHKQAFVSFSHHVPGCEALDLDFFELAAARRVYDTSVDNVDDKTEGWFEVEKLGEWPMPHAHAQGRTVPQFLYRLTRAVS
jgi:hypothetical protein